MYHQLCQYLATLYRFDWYVVPYIIKNNAGTENRILNNFAQVLSYLDNSNVRKVCGDLSLDMIRDGVYYGIIMDFGDKFAIQKLPPDYCRNRYFSGADPIVELNLSFFDAYFANPAYKARILKTFPQEVQRAYVLYKQGKLKGDYPGDTSCWVALDPAFTIKLSLNGDEFPPLVGVIPSIIDLDQAQELDRQKTMQQLLKIIIQKLPLDKNGDLIFDVDEARDIHNNAVAMLKRAVGVDVLTTFADIEAVNTKDSNSATTTDDLEKVERTVYNNSGISHNLFNADGNTATNNSIKVDEARMRVIPLTMQAVLNKIISKFNRPREFTFKLTILETTQFNYQDMATAYKEQASLGYSKLLPQIALGQSQSSILASLYFENQVLSLADIMIPPQSSNTVSSSGSSSGDGGGRPALKDENKSDKTIANNESES